MEKDDTLRLALAVGRILEENGVNAVYTRSTDVYDTPYQKAEMGNEAGADYFVSLHRNAASEPGKGSGVMTLVYKTGRESEQLADSIQRELARTGYVDLGVIERPDLIVLRKTQMPAVLVEAGFIDNPEDNKRFDAQFDEIAAAVASGILNVIDDDMDRRPVEESDYYYQIQTGAYRIRSLAEQQLEELRRMGFPAFLVYDGTCSHWPSAETTWGGRPVGRRIFVRRADYLQPPTTTRPECVAQSSRAFAGIGSMAAFHEIRHADLAEHSGRVAMECRLFSQHSGPTRAA